MFAKPKLAIVGTGIAGLASAYFLHKHYDIQLFDGNAYAGGHTNTVTVPDKDGSPIPIDTGFMVMNPVTYPNLNRFFQRLNVPLKPTDMSFSLQSLPDKVEWAGASVNQLFGQRRNLTKPGFWRFLNELDRFNKRAPALLYEVDKAKARQPIRDFVREEGYSQQFVDWYLLPMSSAIWSTHPERMLNFPIRTLVRFYHNHGFLGMSTHYQWYTVAGGAKTYVGKLLEATGLKHRLHLDDPVRMIAQSDEGVAIACGRKPLQAFDKVLIATHADQALALLSNPTQQQERLLRPFRYERNMATLHTDASVMPHRKRVWSAWNYRLRKEADGSLKPATHYWMNRLQGVSRLESYFVSINDEVGIDPAKILWQQPYDHPTLTPDAIEAQQHLPSLNNPNGRVFFAGSYFRYGFHEDAFLGALNASQALLGGNAPWQPLTRVTEEAASTSERELVPA